MAKQATGTALKKAPRPTSKAEKPSSRRSQSRNPKPQIARATSTGAASSQKHVYLFGKKTDGNGSMKPLLGGKGANPAEMCRIGPPAPPGFTITTEACT